ncbi:MAG: LysM peptidoglycan-binding domain-containing protein [Actinomycetia bacterium]|nr:LysM peptidoglycan-binding domain-containing protein [Actinomycetes bacterium]
MSATTMNVPGFSSQSLGLARPMQAAASWHLTSRGRLLAATATGLALVLAGLVWFSSSVVSVGSADANSGVAAQMVVPPGGSDAAMLLPRSDYALIEHTVVPGDTVWGLAQSVAGEGDPRAAVSRIQKLNNFQSPALQVGQIVLLPVVQ